MNIILINDDANNDGGCVQALERLGHSVLEYLSSDKNFTQPVIRQKPDLLMLRLKQVDDRILNNIFLLQREWPLPVLLFAKKSAYQDANMVLSSGVSTYVIDGYDVARIKALIEVSKARFKQIQGLHQELGEIKRSLDERRIIERAKGIIMEKRGINEDQAYMLLRKTAMNQSKKMVEVARSIIGLADVLN